MYTEDAMLTRYNELKAKVEEVYKKNEPLEEALAKANADAEAARLRAVEIAAEIDTNFGGQSWLALKKEVALLARNLGRPNGPLAS